VGLLYVVSVLHKSMSLPLSVALVGIDSVMAPLSRRQRAWARIARDLDPALLETIVQELPLDGAIDAAHALMEGRVRGRTLIKIGS
jgi:acrylyl-CoA reductase (NADPH)